MQALAPHFLDVADELGEIDVLGVHLGDDDHPTQARLAGFLEHPASVHFDAGVGVDADGGGFDGPHRADRLADEIGIARRVDQIEMLAGVVEVHQGRFDRVLVVLFFFVEVADAGAIVDAGRAGHGAGKVQNLVDQRGFARRTVPAKGNVADVGDVVFGHGVVWGLGFWN